MKGLKYSEYLAMCEKFELGLQEYFFFKNAKFSINFDFYFRCKNEIEDKNEKICNRFNDTVSQEMPFTT